MAEPLPNTLLTISNKEFQALRDLIYERFGINLTEQKRTLLQTRLNKSMKEWGLRNFQELHELIVKDHTGSMLGQLANLISTNHTFFFRESEHFIFLKQEALPAWVKKQRAKRELDLRIWCAAASSGEEPYSILITLMEYLGPEYSQWSAGLLATDISTKALQTAQMGIYPNERVDKIPQDLRHRYFTKISNTEWQVKPELQKEVIYRRFNLMNKQFPFKKPFHIIFCRNVMIYFDQSTIQELINKMYSWTAPGGYLLVGHSESLNRIKNPYRYLRPAVYIKD